MAYLFRWLRTQGEGRGTALTNEQYASSLGLKPGTVKNIASNRVRVSLDVLDRCCRLTGLSFWALLEHVASHVAPGHCATGSPGTRRLLALLWWHEGTWPRRYERTSPDVVARIAAQATRRDALTIGQITIPDAERTGADAFTRALRANLDVARSRRGLPPLGWPVDAAGHVVKPRLLDLAAHCADVRFDFWDLLCRSVVAVKPGLNPGAALAHQPETLCQAAAQLWEDAAPTRPPREPIVVRTPAPRSEPPHRHADAAALSTFPDDFPKIPTSMTAGTRSFAEVYHRTLGTTLRLLRLDTGRSQQGAADAAGLPAGLVRNVEDALARPTLTATAALCTLYERDICGLLVHVAREVSPELVNRQPTADAVLLAAVLRRSVTGTPGRPLLRHIDDADLARLARDGTTFTAEASDEPVPVDGLEHRTAYLTVMAQRLRKAREQRNLNRRNLTDPTGSVAAPRYERAIEMPGIRELAIISYHYETNVWRLLENVAETLEPIGAATPLERYAHALRWYDVRNVVRLMRTRDC